MLEIIYSEMGISDVFVVLKWKQEILRSISLLPGLKAAIINDNSLKMLCQK